MYWILKLTSYDTADNNKVIFSSEESHDPKDILEEYMLRDFLKITEKQLIENYKFTKKHELKRLIRLAV